MTVAEKDGWLAQTTDFLKRDLPEGPQAKRRRLQREAHAIPRLASLDWLRAVENGLRAACNISLSDFKHDRSLLSIPPADAGVIRYPDESLKGAASIPRLAVFTSDQFSVQTCCYSYMKYFADLAIEYICDPFHVSWNSTKEACSQAGLGGTLQACVTVLNVAYGLSTRASSFRRCAVLPLR